MKGVVGEPSEELRFGEHTAAGFSPYYAITRPIKGRKTIFEGLFVHIEFYRSHGTKDAEVVEISTPGGHPQQGNLTSLSNISPSILHRRLTSYSRFALANSSVPFS